MQADTAAEEPPAEEPPAEEPPAEELSAEAPPAEEPPAEAPPAEETPAEALPAEEPYAEAPPAVAPANLPKLKPKGNCVVVMTDPKGNTTMIVRMHSSIASLITYCWTGVFMGYRGSRRLHHSTWKADRKPRNLSYPLRTFPQIWL